MLAARENLIPHHFIFTYLILQSFRGITNTSVPTSLQCL